MHIKLSVVHRPGVTLVEMLLFIAIMAMMAATVLPMLFTSTEARQRQDAIALVEQNGAQILQTIISEVRSAERILDPVQGGTGTILALQTESGATNPTIIGLYSGAIIMIQGRERRVLSSTLVGATSFVIDNTSIADDKQSIAVGVGLRRVIRLHQPLVYTSYFDTVINVNPDNNLAVQDCDCITPFCDTGSGNYVWEVCLSGVCVPHADFECIPEG